ncbi:MAG TPA: MFS transporter [Solirubrobacteraceae bacterium]|nr:MFS transporter [Solirubrobacteraceae bacterium]
MEVIDAINEARISRFHSKAILISGMGFFTDAYDLFIIGVASTLIAKQWHLSATQTGLINSMTLLGAFLGACVLGRLADLIGRKRIALFDASMMLVFALASAVAPSFIFLVGFRFLLGLGVGGDYPVSAVLMSEYANRKDRGRLVGLVFAMQALGTVSGYIAGLVLLSVGVDHGLVWRILLGLGAVPSALVLYARLRMPESPRYLAWVKGDGNGAAQSLQSFSRGEVVATGQARAAERMSLSRFLSNRRLLLTLLGTAGAWFVFDYAYYGNAVSAPKIVLQVLGAGATLQQSLLFNLIVFSVAAVPGYILACLFMDRIGHRRLQLIGFPAMGAMFLLIAVIPGVTAATVPFLLLFGASYFFAEFGPNTTTFVLAAECYPTSIRTTGHGLSAGIAKLGAFMGVYLFPQISSAFGLTGALEFAAGMALAGTLLTLLLPETSRRSLEDISEEDEHVPAGLERLVPVGVQAEAV